jgi:rhodanese-related sulfurtransferase
MSFGVEQVIGTAVMPLHELNVTYSCTNAVFGLYSTIEWLHFLMNIPLGQLIRKARHGDLDDLKRKKIVTYCSGGYRGNIAADELNKLGFDTVNIEGGYSAYKNYGNKK